MTADRIRAGLRAMASLANVAGLVRYTDLLRRRSAAANPQPAACKELVKRNE